MELKGEKELARLKAWVKHAQAMGGSRGGELAFLIRLIEEAHAKSPYYMDDERLAPQIDDYWRHRTTATADAAIKFLQGQLANARAELARLRSPSSADMETRAREVVTNWLDTARLPLTVVTGLVSSIIRLEREAQEAAIEECVQAALEYRDEADAGKYPDIGDPGHSLGQGFAANRIAKKLRALSLTAPQAGNNK